jgi:hypothetical protein
MLKRVGRAQLLARPAYQLDFEHSTFQLAFRYAVTVRFWPFSAGRHYGVCWSSRMQTVDQHECN